MEVPERGRIVLGEYEGEDAEGFVGIGRVFRAALPFPVVVVDLPKERSAAKLEGAEVVLFVKRYLGLQHIHPNPETIPIARRRAIECRR